MPAPDDRRANQLVPINEIVSRLSGRFFAEMSGSNACASDPFGRTVDAKFDPLGEKLT